MAETNVADGRVFDADGQLVAVAGQEIPADAKGPLVYEDHFATATEPAPTTDGGVSEESAAADSGSKAHASKAHASKNE